MEPIGCPTHAPRVVAREVAGTLVLLSLDDGRYFSLDEVGADVWDLCDGTRSVDQIVVAMCRAYDAPPATIGADVSELLEELRDERLVVTAP